jgi:hypothetical protein
LALLLAVDVANHRHPFFNLGQHMQIGGAACTAIGAETGAVAVVTILSDMGARFELALIVVAKSRR